MGKYFSSFGRCYHAPKHPRTPPIESTACELFKTGRVVVRMLVAKIITYFQKKLQPVRFSRKKVTFSHIRNRKHDSNMISSTDSESSHRELFKSGLKSSCRGKLRFLEKNGPYGPYGEVRVNACQRLLTRVNGQI